MDNMEEMKKPDVKGLSSYASLWHLQVLAPVVKASVTQEAFVHQSQTFFSPLPPFIYFFFSWLRMWAVVWWQSEFEILAGMSRWKGVEWNTTIHSIFLPSRSSFITFKDTGSALGVDKMSCATDFLTTTLITSCFTYFSFLTVKSSSGSDTSDILDFSLSVLTVWCWL